MADETKARVFELLDNAVANGFAVHTWTVDQLTDDLMTFDADLEWLDHAQIREAVEQWLSNQKDQS